MTPLLAAPGALGATGLQPVRPPDAAARRCATLVAVGVALLYAAMLPPFVLTPDERSMLAVSLSIIEGRGLAVPEGLGTIGTDGRAYSTWYPLNSALALPAVAVAALARDVTGLPPQYVAAPLVVAWTALLTAFACGVLVRAAVSWGASPRDAVGGAVAYAFGTIALLYGRSFFAESLLGAITLLAAWNAFATGRRAAVLAALLSASAVLAKPAGIVVAVALTTFHVARGTWARVLMAGVGGACGLASYLAYNAARFGSPWTFGQPWGSFTPSAVPEGIAGLLVSPGRGLVWYSPVLAVAVALLVRHALRQKTFGSPAALALLVFGGYLALHVVWDQWAGGWSWGPRLLMPAFPLVLAAAAVAITGDAVRRAALAAATAGVLVGLPMVVTTVSRTMTAANEQGYSVSEQLWTFRAAPLVLSWSSARAQLESARVADARALVRSSGRDDATLATAQAFQVLPLWWWMLPAVGVPRWLGALGALMLGLAGVATIVRAGRAAGAIRGGSRPVMCAPTHDEHAPGLVDLSGAE